MAARARPGAAAGSKWPLKLAPEPQNARKVLLKPGPQPHARWQLGSPWETLDVRGLPWSSSMLEKCHSSPQP